VTPDRHFGGRSSGKNLRGASSHEGAPMPVQTTYPGVYVVEQMTTSHVIVGVSTSVTAFVGAARKGPSDTPTSIESYADFVRQFGDPVDIGDHPMGYAVAHFFANGGS
jgi:Bacteriophage tail sheath protein